MSFLFEKYYLFADLHVYESALRYDIPTEKRMTFKCMNQSHISEYISYKIDWFAKWKHDIVHPYCTAKLWYQGQWDINTILHLISVSYYVFGR